MSDTPNRAKRDAELATREAELAATANALDDRTTALDERNRKIEERAAELDARNTELVASAADLEERIAALNDRADDLHEREQSIEPRLQRLAEREAAADARGTELAHVAHTEFGGNLVPETRPGYGFALIELPRSIVHVLANVHPGDRVSIAAQSAGAIENALAQSGKRNAVRDARNATDDTLDDFAVVTAAGYTAPEVNA